MIKIADFDRLKLPNLILRKIYICVKNEHLGILTMSKVEFSPKLRIQDLQNAQNCSFIPSKIANFDFT